MVFFVTGNAFLAKYWHCGRQKTDRIMRVTPAMGTIFQQGKRGVFTLVSGGVYARGMASFIVIADSSARAYIMNKGELEMKNDDQEQLESLLSIFTGYQVGTVLAILLGILLVTIYLLPDAAILLIILAIVLIAPYLFFNKRDSGEREDDL